MWDEGQGGGARRRGQGRGMSDERIYRRGEGGGIMSEGRGERG